MQLFLQKYPSLLWGRFMSSFELFMVFEVYRYTTLTRGEAKKHVILCACPTNMRCRHFYIKRRFGKPTCGKMEICWWTTNLLVIHCFYEFLQKYIPTWYSHLLLRISYLGYNTDWKDIRWKTRAPARQPKECLFLKWLKSVFFVNITQLISPQFIGIMLLHSVQWPIFLTHKYFQCTISRDVYSQTGPT